VEELQKFGHYKCAIYYENKSLKSVLKYNILKVGEIAQIVHISNRVLYRSYFGCPCIRHLNEENNPEISLRISDPAWLISKSLIAAHYWNNEKRRTGNCKDVCVDDDDDD